MPAAWFGPHLYPYSCSTDRVNSFLWGFWMEEIAVDIETIESWMCFELCNRCTGCMRLMIQWCIYSDVPAAGLGGATEKKCFFWIWFRPFGLVRAVRGLGPQWYTPTLFWWSPANIQLPPTCNVANITSLPQNRSCCAIEKRDKSEGQEEADDRPHNLNRQKPMATFLSLSLHWADARDV